MDSVFLINEKVGAEFLPPLVASYPKIAFRSSSGVVIGLTLNFSTNTFNTVGETNADLQCQPFSHIYLVIGILCLELFARIENKTVMSFNFSFSSKLFARLFACTFTLYIHFLNHAFDCKSAIIFCSQKILVHFCWFDLENFPLCIHDYYKFLCQTNNNLF